MLSYPFFQYPVAHIAALTDDQLENKLNDSGLIRHIGKLKAIRDNAIAWQKLKDEVQDVSAWFWNFVNHQAPNNDVMHYREAPAQTEISQILSKTLKSVVSNLLGQPPAMPSCKR